MEFWVSYKLIGGFALTLLYILATLAYLASKGFLNDAAMAPSAPAATSDNKKTAAGADNTSEQTPRQAG
jgi:hypothetical protein